MEVYVRDILGIFNEEVLICMDCYGDEFDYDLPLYKDVIFTLDTADKDKLYLCDCCGVPICLP